MRCVKGKKGEDSMFADTSGFRERLSAVGQTYKTRGVLVWASDLRMGCEYGRQSGGSWKGRKCVSFLDTLGQKVIYPKRRVGRPHSKVSLAE